VILSLSRLVEAAGRAPTDDTQRFSESLVCESAKSWTLPQFRQRNASKWRTSSPSSAQFPRRRWVAPLVPPVRNGMSPMSTIAVLQLWHLTARRVWEVDSDNFVGERLKVSQP